MATKGYLIVASKNVNFYQSAIMLIESIKDYHPEARVCLVTEERFCDGRESVADHLLHCGDDSREKLWALYNTPFDITFYLDADMECVHEDIAKVFDELGDRDLVFTDLPENLKFLWNGWHFGKDKEHNLKICGAVCLYDIRKPMVRKFLEDWHSFFLQQRYDWWPTNEKGLPDYETYPKRYRYWDQFSLWWMTEMDTQYSDLSIGFFDDPLRWNFWLALEGRERHQPENPIVLRHYSAKMKKKEPFEF